MGSPYVGEIRLFGGNFAPAGWALCQGQLLPISQNITLFQLIGTTYGGDGQSTFALPDLRGRVPVHQGNGFVIGQLAGEEQHTLTVNEIPAHRHAVSALTNANSESANGTVYGGNTQDSIYTANPNSNGTPMAANMIGSAGGSQPHDNMMPTVAVNFIISLFGIFPTQN
jgi:microcystin-dependent protein